MEIKSIPISRLIILYKIFRSTKLTVQFFTKFISFISKRNKKAESNSNERYGVNEPYPWYFIIILIPYFCSSCFLHQSYL